MEKTNKSLKEWNAIVESLGQGKQVILIRSYPTTSKGFLLYPTLSYALRNDFLENFKEEFHPFVMENLLPYKDDDKTEIKYYAKVEKIVEKSLPQISRLNKYHIWHKDHVAKYLKNKKGFIWVLRVYKLENHFMAEINRGMTYANLNNEILISNSKPVMGENSFYTTLERMSL